MNSHNQGDCCGNLFNEFRFENLRNANPPNRKGVYVIRVKERGVPVEKIIEKVKQFVQNLDWELVGKFILNRIRRLKNINQCSIIYIGSAGTRKGSKNTLKGRYKEFSTRHTVMYPIWALLYFKWELELGWKVEDDPQNVESQLKKEYKERHKNKLPALVKR